MPPMRLIRLDRDVIACEQRLAAARGRLSRRRVGFVSALRARIARPDAILAAAGLGVVYGLWVSRPHEQATRTRSTAGIAWRLVRRSVVSSAVSMATSRVMSVLFGPGDAGVDPDGGV